MGYAVFKGTAVYVYFHDSKAGKNRPLPRSETKHLDGATPDQIKSWIENKERTLGYEKHASAVVSDYWKEQLDEFMDSSEMLSKTENTRAWYRKYLQELVLVYFVNHLGLNEQSQWPAKAPKLLEYLISKKQSPDVIKRCNVALRKFWEYLIDQGLVHESIGLRLKNAKEKRKKTPLKFVLTPEAALAFVKKLPKDYALILYLSYFFSLRPQEVFALTRKDFVAGAKAREFECSKIMKTATLYDGLVVNVNKQRRQPKQITDDVKAESQGHVCCFNKDAAKGLIELIKGMDLNQELFEKGNDHYFKKWKKIGPGLTIKDMRRSSIYWLGHNTQIPPIGLKNHARHSKMETTMKYIRRPDESFEDSLLDLDDD